MLVVGLLLSSSVFIVVPHHHYILPHWALVVIQRFFLWCPTIIILSHCHFSYCLLVLPLASLFVALLHVHTLSIYLSIYLPIHPFTHALFCHFPGRLSVCYCSCFCVCVCLSRIFCCHLCPSLIFMSFSLSIQSLPTDIRCLPSLPGLFCLVFVFALLHCSGSSPASFANGHCRNPSKPKLKDLPCIVICGLIEACQNDFWNCTFDWV